MKRSVENPESHKASKKQKVCNEIELQVVLLHEIPKYLRSSYFYQSLSLEDGVKIEIPVKHMKKNLLLCSISDLVELLNTIRFWILDKILPELIIFLLKVNVDCSDILADYSKELKYLSLFLHAQTLVEQPNLALSMIENGWTVSYYDLSEAVRSNSMHCVRYALKVLPYTEYYREEEHSTIMCQLAIENGNIECAELLQTNNFPYPKNSAVIATSYGRVNFLKHMINSKQLILRPGYKLVHMAARNGHLDCLKFLHSNGFPMDYVAVDTVAGGHLDCIQFQVRHGAKITLQLALEAFKHQHESIVLYFLVCAPDLFAPNNSIDWCRLALLHGMATCLHLLHERSRTCFWVRNSFLRAIHEGHFACALYCMKHGGAFNLIECTLIVANPRLGLMPPEQAKKVTAEQNECLQFLLERCERQNIAHDVTNTALKQGNIVALRKLIEQGWPVDCTVAEHAARDNDILTLQVYCAAGHFLPSTICSIAAERGHLAVLQLAHQQGYTWDAKVCAVAAQNGHMKCLKYAQQHQCRLDKIDHTY